MFSFQTGRKYRGGAISTRVFLQKNTAILGSFGDIGRFGDIGTFGNMGTEINFFDQKLKTRERSE